MGNAMTGTQRPLPSPDESFDEHEAKHRFDAALRGARRAHDQRMRGPTVADDKEYALASHHRKGGDRS